MSESNARRTSSPTVPIPAARGLVQSSGLVSGDRRHRRMSSASSDVGGHCHADDMTTRPGPASGPSHGPVGRIRLCGIPRTSHTSGAGTSRVPTSESCGAPARGAGHWRADFKARGTGGTPSGSTVTPASLTFRNRIGTPAPTMARARSSCSMRPGRPGIGWVMGADAQIRPCGRRPEDPPPGRPDCRGHHDGKGASRSLRA